MLISFIAVCSECKKLKIIDSSIRVYKDSNSKVEFHNLCIDCNSTKYDNYEIIEKKEANECSTLIH